MSNQKYSFNLSTQRDSLIYQRVHAVLSAESLLSMPERRDAIDTVRRVSGAPSNYFEALYIALIESFATFLQNIPSLRNHRMSWLDRHLNIASTLITLREPFILAGDLLNRVTDNEKALWNYTMFSGMLLSRIGDIVAQYDISLCNENGLPTEKWDPLLGNLSDQGEYYRLNKMDGTQSTFPAYHLKIATQLMPPDGLHWIMLNQDAFEQWVLMLNGEGDYDYPTMYFELMMFLENWIETYFPQGQAHVDAQPTTKIEVAIDRLLNIPSHERWALIEKNLATERALGGQFLEWLRKGIANHLLAVNKANASIFLTREGALLINPAIFNQFRNEHALHAKRDVLRAFSQLELVAQSQLQRYKTTFPGSAEQQVEGLLIKDAKTLFTKNIPAQTDYVVPSQGTYGFGNALARTQKDEVRKAQQQDFQRAVQERTDQWPVLRQQLLDQFKPKGQSTTKK